ncbi:MAG: hypothetical protein JXA14_08720 [Anaerolineae bacterium]|nr:hypothetical protein [Anaerolineae bacterium]
MSKRQETPAAETNQKKKRLKVHGYQKTGFLGMYEYHEGFHDRYRGYESPGVADQSDVGQTLVPPRATV